VRLDVTIAGQTRRWCLHGMDAASDWFSRVPWLDFQGPLIVSSPFGREDELLETFAAEMRRSNGVDASLTRVTARDNVLDSFVVWMEMEAVSPRQVAVGISQCVERCRRVFAFSPRSNLERWVDDSRQLLETAQKVPDGLAFGIVLFMPPEARETLTVRLDVGWPARAQGAMGPDSDWVDWLHEQVAWHAGGLLDACERTGSFLNGIPPRRPELVEQALDDHADRAFDQLGATQREALAKSVAVVNQMPNLTLPSGIGGVVLSTDTPVPWLARALLRRVPGHPERQYLRSITTCVPRSMRLLGRCQLLEHRCRDRLVRVGLDGEPSEQASILLRASRGAAEGDGVNEGNHTHGRDSAWEFEEFAQLIKLGRISKAERRDMDELRRLRNHLAHGQPVRWDAERVLAGIERNLSAK
jgi:hypothetical protein